MPQIKEDRLIAEAYVFKGDNPNITSPRQQAYMDIYNAASNVSNKWYRTFREETGQSPAFDKANRQLNPALFDAWWVAKEIANAIYDQGHNFFE